MNGRQTISPRFTRGLLPGHSTRLLPGHSTGLLPRLSLVVALWFVPHVAWAQSVSESDLEDRVEVILEELARIREQMAIPETQPELTSTHGMGPAASKVYQARQGVSLGGYGEFYFASPVEDTATTGAVNVADMYRFITYFGYKFNSKIVMNTEIEFEHATTSSNFAGSSGSVSVEFSYLDFLLSEKFNVRAGNLLLPVGFVNELHEPPFYRGNFRPDIERNIIPSTWRELGVGAHGQIAEGVRYTAYLVNGMNGAKFSNTGVRGGRQKGNRAVWEDVAGVLNVQHDTSATSLAGSFYTGGADQNQLDGLNVSNWIAEAHGELRHNGFSLRALVAKGHIEGAAELTESLFPDPEDPDEIETRVVPEDQLGWYVEAAYDLGPTLLGSSTQTSIEPWVRYEDYNLQDSVPDVLGRSVDLSRAVQSLTVGVDVQPHPNVALKFDYVHTKNDADKATSDEVRLGAGFVY